MLICNVIDIVSATKGAGGPANLIMKTEQQIQMDRAKFLVEKAFEEDEQDNNEEASELYMQAVELCLTLVGDLFSSLNLVKVQDYFFVLLG